MNWPLAVGALIWLVLLAALGLTLTAAVLAQRAADAREQAGVLRAVEEDMRRLQARMDAYVALLRATRAFIDTQDERLSRETFAEEWLKEGASRISPAPARGKMKPVKS